MSELRKGRRADPAVLAWRRGQDQPIVLKRDHPPGALARHRAEGPPGRGLPGERCATGTNAGSSPPLLVVSLRWTRRSRNAPRQSRPSAPIGKRRADRRHGPGPRSCAGDTQPARLRRDRRSADHDTPPDPKGQTCRRRKGLIKFRALYHDRRCRLPLSAASTPSWLARSGPLTATRASSEPTWHLDARDARTSICSSSGIGCYSLFAV